MSIEIKELHIRINVDEGSNSSGNGQSGSTSMDAKTEIITTCVEEIMSILDNQRER